MKGKANKWSARVIERESNGRRRPAWFIYIFFILNPNRFGSVRVGRFRHTKTRNRTESDIFLNILTGLVFSVNFFPVFSVKSVFQFFCSPLILRTKSGSVTSRPDEPQTSVPSQSHLSNQNIALVFSAHSMIYIFYHVRQ